MPTPSEQYLIPHASSSGYDYVGDEHGLGGLQLTKLAQSYEELYTSSLDEYFPVDVSPERTVVVTTITEGIGLSTLVAPGIPAPESNRTRRIFKRTFEPALFRDNLFFDMWTLNQKRDIESLNMALNPNKYIEQQIAQKVADHNRMIELLRVQALLGGISWHDPRTDISIDVPSLIPSHNYWSYKGWDDTLASSSTITTPLKDSVQPLSNFTNNKGRKEALYFTNVTKTKIGVPFTHKEADIIRAIRFLKHFYKRANKNIATDIAMSGDMYTILMENESVKAQSGALATFGTAVHSQFREGPNITVENGELTSILGMKIHQFDHQFPDFADGGKHKNMWPSHKIVLFARNHVSNPSAVLGSTMKPVGEAYDGKPGFWVIPLPSHTAPNVPGRAVQMGDAFLPFLMYPHWVMVVDVCDANELEQGLMFRDEDMYMTF